MGACAGYPCWYGSTCTGLWLPGVHALHQDLILFTLHHVIGEHGVKVWDGGRQNNPVSAEFMIPNLQGGQQNINIQCSHLHMVL